MAPSPTASSSSGSSHSSLRTRPIDPVTRTALRYTVSPREYELLHQYLISRAPRRVQARTPDPARYRKLDGDGNGDGRAKGSAGGSDSNASAMRAALRVFVIVYVGVKGYESLTRRLAARNGKTPTQVKSARAGSVRIALSFSGILLFHRLLHRFLRRLRSLLLDDNAKPFRLRNPRTTRLLTSPYTPVVGAAAAGLLLNISPSDRMRATIAIYVFSRSLEFAYNALEESGRLWGTVDGKHNSRPWWFGSWLLMPPAFGQLLHAFVFDRDCFPEDFGRFILQRSPEYIQTRPHNYRGNQAWPGTFAIVDALAELSRLHWPPFVSPILFPNNKMPLPSSIAHVAPITSPANPAIKHTSCALLHPHDPSCARVYARYIIRAFPSIARFFTLIYGAFALLAYKSLLKAPVPFLNRLSARILRMSVFVTGAIGTSWASICAANAWLPRSVLPTERWFLGGAVGGAWAFVAREHERANFLYSARLSLDSFYQVGRKRGWWHGIRGGDVLLFTASLALMGAVYEARPAAVRGPMIRKALSVTRGEGWVDRAAKTTCMDEQSLERRDEQEDVLGKAIEKE